MPMVDETELLKGISHKLSQLIVLTKLSNAKVIAETKEEIKKDPISRLLLSLADGSLSSSQLNERARKQTKKSKRTVAGRIAELVDKGALTPEKKGSEIYYENSGLYG
jgi:DNA-binding transcriptional ArsR family regulator